jgi:hypothetical protein
MIECIFTIDYEIYGNGQGSLKELVYEPAERLRRAFQKFDARFVPFVEVAELEVIEGEGSDEAIDLVKDQLRGLYKDGFTPELHLHPQWYNAQYENGAWSLDYTEYNLCTLPRERIVQIVDRAIDYFRGLLGVAGFSPLAFRAGNWLFQPTRTAANVLAERGIRIDSSVFKGGVRHEHGLDYRGADPDGYYWKFAEHAHVPDPSGDLLEVPIYTQMVPFWKMATPKRVSIERRNVSASRTGTSRWHRFLDLSRVWHPLKLDFCRMTLHELTRTVDAVIEKDRQEPAGFKPLVLIGHTKELVDIDTVESFLSYLGWRGIAVSTFADVYHRCT